MSNGVFKNLCAMQWSGYILDVIVVVCLLGFMIVSSRKGFIECLFGFASTILAIFIAVAFAKTFLKLTDGLFGLQDFFDRKFTHSFSKLSGFDTDISEQGLEAALQGKDISALLGKLALKTFGKGELAVGTTLGMVIGATLAKLTATLISAILLFIVVKLLLLLTKTLLRAIISRLKLLDAVDSLLGAAVGAIECLLLISFVFSVLTVFPSQTVGSYLENGLLVGWLYEHNLIVWLLGFLL
ncbi:MAG: CvpA family protein [Clostridia bacterium]|nr:CvpA family protein [Clostridia bacterium]